MSGAVNECSSFKFSLKTFLLSKNLLFFWGVVVVGGGGGGGPIALRYECVCAVYVLNLEIILMYI